MTPQNKKNNQNKQTPVAANQKPPAPKVKGIAKGASSSKNSPASVQTLATAIAKYSAGVMDPINTPAGLKQPNLYGDYSESSTAKLMIDYPVRTNNLGECFMLFTCNPQGGVNLLDGRGLSSFAGQANPPLPAGYVMNPATSVGWCNEDELNAFFSRAIDAKVVAAGGVFKMSQAPLNVQGTIAGRGDFGLRYAVVSGDPAGVNFAGLLDPSQIVCYANAVAGRETKPRPLSDGEFGFFLVPSSGAEDWHDCILTQYNNGPNQAPVIGYGPSSTDAEQTILLSRFGQSLTRDQMIEYCQLSYGSWSTFMIAITGATPNTDIGVVSLAMHLEYNERSKAIQSGKWQNPVMYGPLPKPEKVMAGTQMIAKANMGLRPLSKGQELLKAGLKLGDTVASGLFPAIYSVAKPLAKALLAKTPIDPRLLEF